MGMFEIFSDNANLTGFLKYTQPLKVTNVIQKAFIEIDEKGSTASAATGNIRISKKKECS